MFRLHFRRMRVAASGLLAQGVVAAPVNTVAPTISGEAKQGSLLTVKRGTWLNTPTSFTYQWRREGVAISPGGNAQVYSPTAADIGKMLTVVETAHNSGGEASAVSAAVGPVTGGGVEPPKTGNLGVWGFTGQYVPTIWGTSGAEGTPWPVGTPVIGVVKMAAGLFNCFVLQPDGTLESWGGNSQMGLGRGFRRFEESDSPNAAGGEGQLGLAAPQPAPVVGVNWAADHTDVLQNVVDVAVGGTHGCVLLASGELRTWGSTFQGGMGNGTAQPKAEVVGAGVSIPASPLARSGRPTAISEAPQNRGEWALTEREKHKYIPVSYALHDFVAFGGVTYICIEPHTSETAAKPPNLTYWRPWREPYKAGFAYIAGDEVEEPAAGGVVATYLCKTATETKPPGAAWELLPNFGSAGTTTGPITKIVAGLFVHFALTEWKPGGGGGKVYAWGSDNSGLLGGAGAAVPTLIPGIENCISVAAGEKHALYLIKVGGTLADLTSGETYILAMGTNRQGQLGNPAIPVTGSSTPVEVQDPTGTTKLTHVIAIAADGHAPVLGTSYAIVEPSPGVREVLAWGSYSGGKLGIGPGAADASLPVKVKPPTPREGGAAGWLQGDPNLGEGLTAINCSSSTCHAIASGRVFGWGANMGESVRQPELACVGIGNEKTRVVSGKTQYYQPDVLEPTELGEGLQAGEPPKQPRPLPSRVLSIVGHYSRLALFQGAVPRLYLSLKGEPANAPIPANNGPRTVTVTWNDAGTIRLFVNEEVEPWLATLPYKAGEYAFSGGILPNGEHHPVIYEARIDNEGNRPVMASLTKEEPDAYWRPISWGKGGWVGSGRLVMKGVYGGGGTTLSLPKPYGPRNPFFEIAFNEKEGTGSWGAKKIATSRAF